MGCSTQSIFKDKAAVTEKEKTVAEQISQQPEPISEETQEETKPESIKISEPVTNNLTGKQSSVNAEPNQTKAPVAQPTKKPQKSGDQVLGATDPNVSELPDWFNIEAPLTHSVHPKKNLIIKWTGSAHQTFFCISGICPMWK
ncbi:hypothetical protein [Desulfosporosinus sp.]|uniref:hypothetical protein n=1 Tax=Desulfosporosinus sp. TaxID=157907 RepID=UPI0025C233BC|nr:hypothetical protein [Desulfosporosinus sp.]MBC2723996.1 hypothetical protein [Desulfosporosinus sp.]MBC2729096.1 hypothetical protein [Desulfosporosinus sp.]